MLKCPTCGAIFEAEQKFCPEDGATLAPYIVAGRYKLLHRLGDGGFGEVYAAEHTSMEKKVALKLLRGSFAKVEEFRQRFEREAKAASRLSHLHCVQVTDFGLLEEGPYLVMELLEGRSLGSLLAEKKIEKRRAIEITKQILSALSHAHAQGIVHRDLKPENIMLVNQAGAKGDFCKILDFGLAKIFRASGSEQKLTQAGMILGTPSYMSPEQATASESDHRAGLYSVGVLLYEMTVGRRPFIGKEPDEILRAHVFQNPMPPKTLSLSMSDELNKVILKSLEKTKEGRYQSADEFTKALEEVPEARSEEAELAALMETLNNKKEGAPAAEPSSMELKTEDIEVPGPSLLLTEKAITEASTVTEAPPKPLLEPTLPAPVAVKKPALPPQTTQLALGVAAVLVLGGAGYLLFGKENPNPTTTTAAPNIEVPTTDEIPTDTSPSRPTIVLEDNRSTLKAEEYLAAGNYPMLAKEISQLAAKEPKNPRVFYLHGFLFYKNSQLVDALQEFTSAIRLDKAYAYDPLLLKTAAGCFEQTYSRATAKNFFMKILPRDISIEALRENTANGKTPDIRQGCADTLKAMGKSDQIDYASKGALDVKQARYCKERLDAVFELKKSTDPKALEALHALDEEGKSTPINSCLGDEVKKAIEEFETQ